MKYAIVENGGKQYKAVEGETLEVDRLPLEVGKKVELKEVLLVADDGETAVGTPTVAGAKVSATVLDQFKGPKILVFKYKPSTRYRLRRGHRQQYTRLLVDSIETKGSAKKKDAKEEPAAVAKAEAKAAEKKETPAASGPSTRAKLGELKIGTRNLNALEAAGITTAGQMLKKLAQGEEAALAIEGFGPKGLEEVKEALKQAGYDLPK